MARAYQVVSVVFLLLGLFVVWQSFEIRYMTRLGPGPGFFGVWLGGLLALMSTIFLVQNTLPRWRRDEPLQLLPESVALRRLLLVVGVLALTVVLMPILGYRLTVFGLSMVILRIVGQQPWWVAIVMSLLFSVGVYFVFVSLLSVLLPVGWLGI